ncbi:asparagine synthase (glutamine-hydrolyzing) [Mariprofundus erugo]|uniref:asparagine synthase (glutamine-hydrolyzing) n=1 Tax=Mariprofundus erugo TaxID=2528639 RepID=A0A5R9GM33_9PROT|nr:asparagine synthase (glutamine-hydrolyzing) [Mariprofundus erugo]TLS66728.1 asparagine synthase (glutamine-hydrolyzing) [Mariprofundus erugo]
MCGIAGIYSYHPKSAEISREELILIRDHMVARGPDGKGEWFSADNRVGLAHRRLSIIDLSEHGSQPMQSGDGRYAISFNGEIYNYRELRADLERAGSVFHSDSDTEVLLHLYAKKGVAMLNDLRGMFAFSLWDNEHCCMVIARDPYGIKPLYYSNDGQTIRIASQVKALMAGGKVSKSKSPAGMAGFFLFGHMPEPYTQYQDVSALPAGHYAVIDESGMHDPVCYFDLQHVFDCTVELSEKEAQEMVFNAMTESINYHLISDVPVGVFLSAGIDSGAILSLAGEGGCRHLQTLTLAFEEFGGSANDESPLAAQVAKHFQVKHHHKRILAGDEFSAGLDGFFEAMDQPTTDGLNTYFVSKAVSELGWKVALSGVGGDEMFCGYPSFTDIPSWVRLMGTPSRIPGLGNIFSHLATYARLNPKAAGLVKYGGTYEGAYLLKRGIFLPEELPELVGKEMAAEGLKQLSVEEHISRRIGVGKTTEKSMVSLLESSLYMRNQLLRDSDWAGMAHSLEIRTPFVDAHLIRKIVPALSSVWNSSGKGLFYGSLNRPLPEFITSRSKTGFYTPVSKWLQSDNRLDVWKSIPSLRKGSAPWARRWAFVVADRSGLLG